MRILVDSDKLDLKERAEKLTPACRRSRLPKKRRDLKGQRIVGDKQTAGVSEPG